MSEKLERLGLTPRILVFSFAWCIFNSIFLGSVLTVKSSDVYLPEFLLFMVESFLMYAVNEKLHFTPQEWAVFLSISMSGLLTSPAWGSGNFRGQHSGLARGFLRSYIRTYGNWYHAWATFEVPTPEIWTVRDPDAIQGFLYGTGGVVPWDLNMPVIGWSIVNFISIYLMYHFFACVLRRPWVDTEALTFPWQRPLYETVKATHGIEGPLTAGRSFWNPAKNKWFWLGFLLAALFSLPDLSEVYFGVNWFPGLRVGDQTYFRHRYQRFIIPITQFINPWWQQGFINNENFTIWISAALILAPMDVLLSAAFFTFLGWVVFQDINYYSGSSVWGGWPDIGGQNQGLIKWRFMYTGMTAVRGPASAWIAIPLILLWRARKHIVHTLKGFVSGGPAEEGEPHSWRIVWLGIIGCFVVWWITMIVAGAPWYMGLTFGIFGTMGFLFQSRWIAEFGGGQFHTGFNGINNYVYFDAILPAELTGTYGTTPQYMAQVEYEINWYKWIAHQAPIAPSLVGFKLGKELNADSRSISIGIILATVIGIIIAVPVGIWTYYYHGYSILAARMGFHFDGCTQGNEYITMAQTGRAFTEYAGYPPDWYGWVIAGIFMIFGVEYLRTTVSALAWMNPFGIAVSQVWGGPSHMLGAIIIKWLSLRYLGGKGYQRITVGTCLGIIMGYGFLYMFGVMSTMLWGL